MTTSVNTLHTSKFEVLKNWKKFVWGNMGFRLNAWGSRG